MNSLNAYSKTLLHQKREREPFAQSFLLSLGRCGWGSWLFIRIPISNHVHVTEEQQLNFPTTRGGGISHQLIWMIQRFFPRFIQQIGRDYWFGFLYSSWGESTSEIKTPNVSYFQSVVDLYPNSNCFVGLGVVPSTPLVVIKPSSQCKSENSIFLYCEFYVTVPRVPWSQFTIISPDRGNPKGF